MVGGAQKLLPAHVVNEYCHPTRPFDPCSDFKEMVLPRRRQFGEGEWFTAKYSGDYLGKLLQWRVGGGRLRMAGRIGEPWMVARAVSRTPTYRLSKPCFKPVQSSWRR